jgi:ceramide glucosyltransferase
LVDLALNGVDGCYGPLTAIHRHVLNEIGGLEGLTNYLAEDNRMGRLVREKGYGLHVERMPAPTMVYETGLRDLIRHEVRWARTVRCCRAFDHLLQVVTFPLPLVAALAIMASSAAGWAMLALHLSSRIGHHFLVRRRIPGSGPAMPWAVPLRECLCFLVWAISLRGNYILWRNNQFRLTAGGRIVPVDTLEGHDSNGVLGGADIPVLVGDESP